MRTLQTLEMGTRIDEARGELVFSADILSCCAQHGESLLAPVHLHPQRGEARVESRPFGVPFCVEPWNFRTASLPA